MIQYTLKLIEEFPETQTGIHELKEKNRISKKLFDENTMSLDHWSLYRILKLIP